MPLKRPDNFKEEDLYEPIRKWLVNNGYAVQAEVVDCDIIGIKNEELHIIELKKGFSLQLVYQCLERQRLSDKVYAAIPIPKKGKRGKTLKNAKTLLGRLGIGLIVVHLYNKNSMVELISEPKENTARKNPRRQKRVQKEIDNRSGNYNKGGVNGKTITAYREASILIYLLLQKEIESTAALLKKLGAPPNTGSILRANHYGWFHKVARGKFTFDVDMETIEAEYGEIVGYYREVISNGAK
jgi:hypothetical protein